MSNVLKIVSEPMNKPSEECFSALVQSMALNNLVAVMKIVRIKNAQPRIGVAIPIIKANYDCMYWCQVSIQFLYLLYLFMYYYFFSIILKLLFAILNTHTHIYSYHIVMITEISHSLHLKIFYIL